MLFHFVVSFSREGRYRTSALTEIRSTVCGLTSIFVLQLIWSRPARRVTGLQNNDCKTAPTVSAYYRPTKAMYWKWQDSRIKSKKYLDVRASFGHFFQILSGCNRGLWKCKGLGFTAAFLFFWNTKINFVFLFCFVVSMVLLVHWFTVQVPLNWFRILYALESQAVGPAMLCLHWHDLHSTFDSEARFVIIINILQIWKSLNCGLLQPYVSHVDNQSIRYWTWILWLYVSAEYIQKKFKNVYLKNDVFSQ